MHDRLNFNMSNPSNQGSAVAATASSLSDYYKPIGDETLNIAADIGNFDLVLQREQGDESIRCRVSLQVMSLSSSYWRAMLDPEKGFKEALSRDEPIILQDPNIEAILLLLFALHNRDRFVLKELDVQDLVDVCMAIDKYDCIASVTSWLTGWMTLWKPHMYEKGYEDSLCTAWVSGEEAIFQRMIFNLLIWSTTNDSKQCFISSGAVFDPPIPPGIAGTYSFQANAVAYKVANTSCLIDVIVEARETVIIEVIEACHAHMAKYTLSTHVCRAAQDQIQCDDATWGSLGRQLLELGMWTAPAKESKDIASDMRAKTISEIGRDLKHLRSHKYPDRAYSGRGAGSNNGNAHDLCCDISGLYKVVQGSLGRQMRKIVELHRPYMSNQRQKLSLSNFQQCERLTIDARF